MIYYHPTHQPIPGPLPKSYDDGTALHTNVPRRSADWLLANGWRPVVKETLPPGVYTWGSPTDTGTEYHYPAGSVELDRYKTDRKASINNDCRERITAIWPIEEQSSCLMGIYPQAEQDDCANWIAANIAASNTATDAIDAAVDATAVAAVSVSWPVYSGVKS